MTPEVAQVVLYTLSDTDADAINSRRDDAGRSRISLRREGAVVHTGNPVAVGDVYPMVIVRVWAATDDSAVNGQVLLDGTDTLWVTSTICGDGPGHFAWPQTTMATDPTPTDPAPTDPEPDTPPS